MAYASTYDHRQRVGKVGARVGWSGRSGILRPSTWQHAACNHASRSQLRLTRGNVYTTYIICISSNTQSHYDYDRGVGNDVTSCSGSGWGWGCDVVLVIGGTVALTSPGLPASPTLDAYTTNPYRPNVCVVVCMSYAFAKSIVWRRWYIVYSGGVTPRHMPIPKEGVNEWAGNTVRISTTFDPMARVGVVEVPVVVVVVYYVVCIVV